MKKRNFFYTTLIIFIVVTIVHFLRVVFGWPANIGNFEVPMWVSWAAFLIAGYLAYHSYRHLNK